MISWVCHLCGEQATVTRQWRDLHLACFRGLSLEELSLTTSSFSLTIKGAQEDKAKKCLCYRYLK